MATRRAFLLGGSAAALAGALANTVATAEAVLGDDGLYKPDFLLNSFLEIGDDLSVAREEGRGLLVLFEQRGCPYCREMHEVNFQDPRIADYMTEHFDVLQLDLWGSREVIDIDGAALEERDLALKWGVNFTPTTVFFAKDGPATEVFRMPGYFKPFHHRSGLEYVAEGHYADAPFQRYLQDKFAELEALGIEPEVW